MAPRVRPLEAGIVATAAGPAQFPLAEIPEFAFAGRSNVGKSSLLNRLAGRRSLARTSAEPGKTRLIHFYRVECVVAAARRAFLLVDLPGYGYAKVSKAERNRWRDLVESYLHQRAALRVVIVLQDIRRELADAERELLVWLAERGSPALLVLTKIDKLSPMQRAIRIRALTEAAGLPEGHVIATSAVTSAGVEALWEALLARAGSSEEVELPPS
jgi:GTP-binding protein